MHVLIIGSTGKLGRELVRQGLARGHDIVALARNPADVTTQHERLTVITGNVLRPDDVDRAVMGCDAVISALGHHRFFVPNTILSDGTHEIIRAMSAHGVRRFICVTALGVGDSKWKLGLYYTLFVEPVIVWFYFRDKERQEKFVRESGLEWTIVRPGQLTNGRQRGAYRQGTKIGSWWRTALISRADVAAFMLDQLTDRSNLRRTVELAY